MTDYERKKYNKEKLHMVLINRIDELCIEKGYTLYALAYIAAMPLTTLTNIMNGKSVNPSFYTIVKICDAFDMTLAEFVDTEEFETALIESRDEK